MKKHNNVTLTIDVIDMYQVYLRNTVKIIDFRPMILKVNVSRNLIFQTKDNGKREKRMRRKHTVNCQFHGFSN